MFNIQQLFLAAAAAKVQPVRLDSEGNIITPYHSKHYAARVQRARAKRIKARKRPL